MCVCKTMERFISFTSETYFVNWRESNIDSDNHTATAIIENTDDFQVLFEDDNGDLINSITPKITKTNEKMKDNKEKTIPTQTYKATIKQFRYEKKQCELRVNYSVSLVHRE